MLDVAPRAVVACLAAVCLGTILCRSAAAFVEPPVPPPTFPAHVGGRWGPVFEWPHIPMAMAHLPDGRILAFSANEANAYPSTFDEYTHATVWDPGTGSIEPVPHPGHDLFCAAIVTLESGETFVMGGHNGANSPWVSYFDFHDDRWVLLGADGRLNRGRWYPTAVYMGSGQVFIAGGIGGGEYPELWTPGVGWSLQTGIDLTNSIRSLGDLDGAGNWPLLQLSPDGTIFHHGATATMNRIDPAGGIGGLGTITDLGPHGFGWFPGQAASVFYDVGQILVAGGWLSSSNSTAVAHARRIDINGPGPVITPAAPMSFPRVFMNEVILPTGDVFVVGGNTTGFYFSDWNAVLNPEVWDPDTDAWTLLNPHDQARTYHSTALLLPDGTVVSAGGGMLGQPCDGLGSPGECGVDHWNAEVYSPPYLFNPDDTLATRPVIDVAPGVARVGRTITVHASPGLSGFSMVRMSGATHTMNTDQRFFRPVAVETSPGIYSLTLHANENVLVPGYWMLFALEGEVPSIAKAVQIVNDGTPRGPPIDGRNDDVGDEVLVQIEVEDPDGNPITFSATGLPAGLSLSPATGIIEGTLTTPGLYNVSILAFDGVDAVELDFQWVVSTEQSEAGVRISTPTLWTTVPLAHAYDRPVVVMGPASASDPDPVVVRVRNVTSTSFQFRIDEWPYQGGAHGSETVSYLVVEAGEYALPGGGTLVAGISTGVDFQHPKSEPFSAGAFASTPVVLAQLATAYAGPGARPMTARIDDVSTGGFSVRIQEQEQDAQIFPAEDVHWIAIEPTAVPGVLEAGIHPSGVDEAGAQVDFTGGFSGLPRVFAQLQTTHELDPVTLRYQNVLLNGFRVLAQEEASADAEVDHALEGLGWLAVDPGATTFGLLPLFNEPPSVGVPMDQVHERGQAISLFVQAADPDGGALTFSASGLPPGLGIDGQTGEIAGTLTLAGSYVVSVTVTDANGDSDRAVFLWTVKERLEIAAFPTPPGLDGTAIDYHAATNIPGSFEYSWDFGDGSPPIGPSTSPETQHVFPGPGRYVVTLTVEDPLTQHSDTRQFTQIVALPPTPSAPTASSSIVYEPANDRVWAVNPDSHSVAVIDALTHARIAEIAVGAGPRTLAVAGDGRVWVACKEASLVAILDPVTLGVVQTIPLKSGASPYGIVFDPAGTTAFVALEDAGEILRFDGLTGALLGSRSVGRNVRHLSVTADGATLRAARFVTPPLPGESQGVPQTESGGSPVGGEVLSLDAATLTLGATTILRVNLSADTELNARGVPNYLGAPVISPDGTQLLVPSKQDNVLRGGFRDGLPLTHDSTVRAISSRVLLPSGQEDVGARLDHDNASVASATLWSAFGAYAFTTLEGNRQLAVIDSFSHAELARVDTGRAPHGMALSPDGSTLYVDNFMDRSVSVFDLSALMDFGDADLPLTATIAKGAAETLSAEVLLGKQLFYDAADPRLSSQSYLFCAACHADGRQDGRTWDFTHLGQGLRNTIALEGHGEGQGPLHWAGNFDEVQDFEAQIRAFGGTGLLSASEYQATEDPLGPPKAGLDPELDALAAYVESLTSTGSSPARASDGSLTPEALAGRALFESAGCGACHLGPQFSDSAAGAAHDVGTLEPWSGPQTALDTPTLRGLWRTAPYLHDGSAASLDEAIAAHAATSLLPAERASLAAYLEQIDDAEATAPNGIPVVVVTSPADGASAFAGTPVLLSATATDPEEGDLSAAIVWTSDRDGVLGTGGSLSVSSLSTGSHVVTASATDGGDQTGEDQVGLTIVVNVGPTVTITGPLEGSTFVETLPVAFAATATDPEDGDLGASIVWTSSLDGPIGTGASFARSDLSPGVHVITAFVTDSMDLPDSELVSLTIETNVAPELSVTSPTAGATATQGAVVDLIATASDANEGDLTASIAWSSDLDGPLGLGGTLALTTLSLGSHVLTATVSDGLGLSDSVSLGLTIEENAPPSVSITSPANGATASEGTLVPLAATAQDAEDGDLSASLAWSSSLDGALGSGGALALGTLSVGTHTLTAAVTDALGLTASAVTTLTVVVNAAPVVTITSPVGGAAVTAGLPVDLVATAVDAEDGDLAAAVVWSSSRDGTLGTGGTLRTSLLSVGVHTLTATATDSLGRAGSAAVSLTINTNGAPTVTISSPADGSTAIADEVVGFAATASDPEEGELGTAIVWTSSLDGVLGTGPSLALSTLSLGTHTVTASVSDGLGLAGSDAITLTIAVNTAPVVAITAPTPGTTATQGTLVPLTATAQDVEDGDLSASLAWSSSLDGPLGSGGNLALSTLSLGTHLLTASVTDGLGLAGSDTVTLTIAANAAPSVTITSPADGATASEGVPVALIATASDPEDGDRTAAIAWSSDRDGALGVGGSLSIGTLSPGAHVLTAQVSDTLGWSASHSIDLTIVPNVGPTLTLTAPADGTTVTQGVPITLVASASDPEEGDLSSAIAWSSDRDGALGTGPSLTLSTLTVGTHALTASIIDAGSRGDSESILLTIAVNAAPTVAITSPAPAATATEGILVPLVATAQDPEDGDLTASLAWSSSLDGPLGSGGNLALSTLSVGTHTLTASVSDGLGLAGSDAVTLTIAVNAAPTVALTSPADGATITAGLPVDLVATAVDAEDGNLAAGIVWSSSRDGALGTGGTLRTTLLSVGVHTLTATATDSLGRAGSAAVSLTISANVAPTVTISLPADGSSASEGAVVSLAATASDPEDGELGTAIVWTSSLDGVLGQGASLTLSTLSLGTHTVTASVSDGLGVAGSDAITLTIAANEAPSVTITSPADGATASEGVAFALIATASDPEEGDLSASIAWTSSLDGPLGSGASLTLATLSRGVHTLSAAVTDGLGLAASDAVTLTITANAAPSVTITSPAFNATVTQGTPVVISGTATDPEEGDMASSIVWVSSVQGALGTGASLVRNDLQIGVHFISAMVIDDFGNLDTMQVPLRVVANALPSLVITSPIDGGTAYAGTSVALIATASDPEDGDRTAAITWSSNRDGALGSGGSLSIGTLSPGAHVLTAQVSDTLGRATSRSIGLTIVANIAPTVTLSAPADGTTVTQGVAITLVAGASDPEEGDLSSAIAWSSDRDGALGTGPSLTLSTLTVGTHALTAAVSDQRGLADTATLTVNVVPNAPPSVSIVSPVGLVEISELDTLELIATAVDPEDGELGPAAVWTSSLDGLLGTGDHVTVDALSVGEHEIAVSVTDSLGATATAQTLVSVPEPRLLAALLSGMGLLATFARRRSAALPRHSKGCGALALGSRFGTRRKPIAIAPIRKQARKLAKAS